MSVNIFFTLTQIQAAILLIFTIAFLLQTFYYLGLFSRIAFFKHRKSKIEELSLDGISVVICARNERDQLKNFLPKILEQGHPSFEVVVVNNCSTDDSDEVLTLLKNEYSNLIIRTITLDEPFLNNNSIAWGVGIKAAKYEWIVLTDANCFPKNENWLAALQQNFNKGTEVVLSYSKVQNNKWIRADNFFDALYYLSKACFHKPYTGSGENLAFRKSLFFKNKGFHALLKHRDKADHIFVNTIANKNNTVVDVNSINYNSLKLSFSEWRLKRREELSSQRLFRKSTRNSGWLELFSRITFYAVFIVAVLNTYTINWALITIISMFFARLGLQILIFLKSQKRLQEKGLLLTSLCWDFISPFIYIPMILKVKINKY